MFDPQDTSKSRDNCRISIGRLMNGDDISMVPSWTTNSLKAPCLHRLWSRPSTHRDTHRERTRYQQLTHTENLEETYFSGSVAEDCDSETVRLKVRMTKGEAAALLARCSEGRRLQLQDVAACDLVSARRVMVSLPVVDIDNDSRKKLD
uniref:DUF7890 domain-containing protein n=1 Tax=Kalanchoe fedtschenkoi TaxID=63787 RepID=A0A7N0R9H3_KALFE